MLATAMIENQPFELIDDFEVGYANGSLWKNLYSPYKYENTNMNNCLDEADSLMYLIMVYSFASLELNLYLCTHKDNQACIDTLKNINTELNKMIVIYENKYRVITSTSPLNNGSYINNPWPWEGM